MYLRVLFFAIFPAVANFNNGEAIAGDKILVLSVALPCPGHAPLVTQDLLSQPGVSSATYELNNNDFIVSYDAQRVSAEQILARKIFTEFKAKIISN